MLKKLHYKFIFRRRVRVLAHELAACIEPGTNSLLDIGTGDGAVSKLIGDSHPQLKIFGIDTMARPQCAIPYSLFDGRQIPFADNTFDTCMLVDVLHHLSHIKEMLAEAKRVAGKYILVKDHLCANTIDLITLKVMDDVGNRPHGVAMKYNYLKKQDWEKIFKELGLVVITTKTRIPLYPVPFDFVFGRRLHFISLLAVVK